MLRQKYSYVSEISETLAVVQGMTHWQPSVLLSAERNAVLRYGFLIQLREQGKKRANLSLCGVCLPHIIIFKFIPGEENHPGWFY